MINTQTLGSKESLGVRFKDSICTEFCLKLWFESDWYFCNITESEWFWKQPFRNKGPNNYFLKSVWKIIQTEKSPKSFKLSKRSLWKSGQLFSINISFPIRGSIKLVIINMTYVVRWAIWYHFYNLKNVQNTHGEVLILVKL